jgi:hypothetical protein
MACKIEAYCKARDICELADVVQGNPCNSYIAKKDTPADYLPGDKPNPEDLRFLLALNTPRVLTCAGGQTITIKE